MQKSLPPRPSLTLVRAGSVFMIAPANVAEFDDEKLRSLEHVGAGSRRAEGFGQIRVNACEVTQTSEFIVSRDDAKPAAPEIISLARSDEPAMVCKIGDFARAVEDAAWRTYLRMRAEEVFASAEHRKELLGWTPAKPTASQLGKLRGLLNGARSDEDIEAVRKWLKTRPTGWNGNNGPEEKLRQILDDPFDILVDVANANIDECATATVIDGVQASVSVRDRAPSALARSRHDIREDKTLKRYAVAAIVHAALRAHRRAAETSRKKGKGKHVTGDQAKGRETN